MLYHNRDGGRPHARAAQPADHDAGVHRPGGARPDGGIRGWHEHGARGGYVRTFQRQPNVVFYPALHRGRNPFFYVWKSPRNLYVPLIEFMQRQQLPASPLLLRDFGLRMERDHKTRAIEDILATYPALKFILIGDSGEQDPEIYSEIVSRFPERIRVTYIRSVDPSPARLAAIAELAKKVAATACQLMLAPGSEFAAAHAAAEGLINADELHRVRVDKTVDRSA